MEILLTNDDGISAPGLWALHAGLNRLGNVTVIAPRTEQSGIGHAITYRTPITAEAVRIADGQEGYALTGTPADCVKFALLQFLEQPPDLIVSGINIGLNLGHNLFYSGTVAAALEGAMNGVLSAAFSTSPSNADRLPRAAEQAVRVLKTILDDRPGEALAYNVNLPSLRDGVPDITFTHHQAEPFLERYVPQAAGSEAYQLDLHPGDQDPTGDGSDVQAVETSGRQDNRRFAAAELFKCVDDFHEYVMRKA